jgi:Protein of unknown function (DUF3102)/ParB-like nuclease domain
MTAMDRDQRQLVEAASTILAQNAEVIRALGKRVVGDIIEIGRRLSECKELCGHGNWLPWLKREFGWGDDTALNYMRCADLAISRNFRDLSIPVSGLYLLAAPSTPEEARQEVIERVENGERLSVKDVKELIDEARNKQAMETAELLAAREAEIRAQYVRGFWSRKPPPEPVTDRGYYLQFLRTKLHPVAETASPLMKAEEFAGLVKSIKAHGQRDPIILVEHDGEQVILDGVCREIACGIAGVEPKYRTIEVDDPRSYWISVNCERVHLTKSQQAMGEAILTEPDADDEAYDPDQLPPPIVAARYVRAHEGTYISPNRKVWFEDEITMWQNGVNGRGRGRRQHPTPPKS